MEEEKVVIVTRHQGAVEWLKSQGIEGKVISHADADAVRGKVVIGNIPLNLAALAAVVMSIEMPNIKPEDRGRDLTSDEMIAAGAQLRAYVIFDTTDRFLKED